jgi:hypothetical protein
MEINCFIDIDACNGRLYSVSSLIYTQKGAAYKNYWITMIYKVFIVFMHQLQYMTNSDEFQASSSVRKKYVAS